MAEVTYYFDADGASQWANPSNFDDNNLVTFASEAANGEYHLHSTNTCPGTDLGVITKVELRVYGYGDGNDRIDIRPLYLSGDGVSHPVTMPSSADWSAYVDVTTEPSAPPSWNWVDVVGLQCICYFVAIAKGNTMYGAKVEIRVTYTPSGGYYHGLKVQGEGELALCDVGNNPLRIRKGGTTYGIELVATDDPNASKVRIKTGVEVKAIRKYT